MVPPLPSVLFRFACLFSRKRFPLTITSNYLPQTQTNKPTTLLRGACRPGRLRKSAANRDIQSSSGTQEAGTGVFPSLSNSMSPALATVATKTNNRLTIMCVTAIFLSMYDASVMSLPFVVVGNSLFLVGAFWLLYV